jgi:hypothetical protein
MTVSKVDFEMDFDSFFSKILYLNTRLLNNVKKLTSCLINTSNESSGDIEIIEDYGQAPIDSDLLESLTNTLNDLKNEFAYNTLLIASFSYVEYTLKEFCLLLDKYSDNEIKYATIKDDKGINKVRTYLNTNFSIDIGQYSNWAQLKNYQTHRNLVIHNDSNIIIDPNKPIEKQSGYNIISRNKLLEIAENGNVFIKDLSYIEHLIEIGNEFISSVINETKTEIKHSS